MIDKTAISPEALRAAEAGARLAETRLRSAIDALPEGIVFLDHEGRYVLWNQTYADIYRGSADLFEVGARLEDTLRIGVQRGHYPEAVGREDEWLAERMSLMANPGQRHEQRLADGRWILIEERKTADGGTIGLRVDITELKQALATADQALKELEQTRTFLDTILESMPAMLFVTEYATGRFVSLNRVAEETFGYDRHAMIGKSYAEVFSPEQAVRLAGHDRALDAGGGVLVVDETPVTHADGSVRLLHVKKTLIRDPSGAPQYVLGVCEDITERRRNEARIAHMASHDALTDLPNRVLFHDHLESELSRARGRSKLAVLCVDLDHFKTVNDTLGHPIGDALLQAVARRLADCVREGDMVARLGGDEFAVIQHRLESNEAAGALAERIVETLGRPYDVDGHQVVIGASVGISLAPADGDDADDLLKKADMALYRSKAEGRGAFHYFEHHMDEKLQSRRRMELDLRRALAAGEFELHYQPLLSLGENRINGCEALVRWRCPIRGMVQPGEFIPLAEEIGLIAPLGDWVLRTACRQAAQWPDHMKVAVNLSPVQFRARGLVSTVVSALATSGLAPQRLELEITESVLLQDNAQNLKILHELRGLGVRIVMDDFGTGYSSLSYLRSFPFDKIKIDRSFVADMSDDSDALAIVRAVSSLGASLGILTTAEGVESADQLEQLKDQGCSEIQGFFISKPCDAAALDAFIELTEGRRVAEAAEARDAGNGLDSGSDLAPPAQARRVG